MLYSGHRTMQLRRQHNLYVTSPDRTGIWVRLHPVECDSATEARGEHQRDRALTRDSTVPPDTRNAPRLRQSFGHPRSSGESVGDTSRTICAARTNFTAAVRTSMYHTYFLGPILTCTHSCGRNFARYILQTYI